MSVANVLDRFPTPPCARFLGLDIIDADPTEGRVRIAFEARSEFCNAAGGILSAAVGRS
jgi:acyl-coenzyme A thioesterase PaaI-like protein